MTPVSRWNSSPPIETRTRLGITPGLVRISVCIEDVEDLIAEEDMAITVSNTGYIKRTPLETLMACAFEGERVAAGFELGEPVQAFGGGVRHAGQDRGDDARTPRKTFARRECSPR